jgi:hypothetical protein
VRWCGGARQTRSVGPRGAVVRPREAASAERDVEGALGARTRGAGASRSRRCDERRQQTVGSGRDRPGQHDDPRRTAEPRGTRPSLIGRHPRCGVGDALHHRRPGGSITAQRRGPSPWVWGCGRHFRHPWTEAAGSRGHPLDLIHGSLKGARRCPSVSHPAGWQGGSRTLFSDPVPGSSVRVVCPHAGECHTTIRPRRWRRRRAGPSRATSASARTPFRGA